MFQLNPHHIFKHDGNYYLINIEKMAASPVDDMAIARALKDISANPHYAIEHGIREKFKKFDLLPDLEAKPEKKYESEPIPVQNIALFVTQQCNFRCVYCYGDGGRYGTGGEMRIETARKAVDWFIEQSQRMKKLHISFFGGEPLLNFSLIKDVVQYALKRGTECGKQFEFNITTNGSLLDDEKIVFLKEYKIEPFISIDGPKELQDTQRPFENGQGTYETVVEKAGKLLEVFPEAACCATLVGNNDPVTVDQALREMGFMHRIVAGASRSLFDSSEHPGDGSRRDLSGMHKKAKYEASQLLAAIGKRDTENLNDLKGSGLLFGFVALFVNQQKRYSYCGAGKGTLAVSCSGDVYLCHRFVGMEDQRLGDIFTKGLNRQIYLNDAMQFRERCAKCFVKYICAGGCYHDNLSSNGSVFEPDEDMCVLIRRSAELAAAVCSRLTEEDRAYLVKEKIIEKKTCPLDLF